MRYSGVFRPWGNLAWLFPKLPKGRFKFAGCLGTEDRCLTAFQELSNLGRIDEKTFVRILDPESDYSALAYKKRDANLKHLTAIGVSNHEIREIGLLDTEDAIVSWIDDVAEGTDRLVIDISSLPKRFFFPAIKLLLQNASIRNLIVTYTIPASYHQGNLAERPSDWRALPLFSPEVFPDPTYEIAVVGVGFLPFGLPDLLKSGFLTPKPYLFFPFPATPSTNFKTWEFVRQINESLTLDTDDQLIRVNALDPSDAFDHICWLTESNRRNALFAPYGPKPMSLGIAIYAALTGSPVYYTQPRVYHPDYSKGVQYTNSHPDVYAYCLKLNGSNLFSI